MKNDGNHGGYSDQESNTVLFCFTRAANFLEANTPNGFSRQTSLAPTLSLLLNVSVPAGNLA